MENDEYANDRTSEETFLNILLIEDNEDDAVFLRELLAESDPDETFLMHHCPGLKEGLSTLLSSDVDLLLLDLGLAECKGLETLRRALAADAEIPIVVLSGLADKSTAIEALRNGAQDYLVKGQIQSETLWRCIHYAIERHQLQEEIKQQREKAKETEERFRRLIELNVDGMVIVDSSKKIRLANKAAERFLGKPADKLIGEEFDFDCLPENSSEITVAHPEGELVAECRLASITWEDENAFLISMRDVTDRKGLEKELYKLANYDSLTGVYNRRVFFERLGHEVAMTQRYGQPLSVLMEDVDRFKKINDTYGHQTGDRVLQRLAEICQNSLRTTDAIGRLGGEEFGVILPHTDLIGAQKVGERLREKVEKTEFDINDHSIGVTVTVGVTSVQEESDPDQIMDKVDQALYRGKAAGRNQVVCA